MTPIGLFLFCLLQVIHVKGYTRFTNLKCENLDTSYVNFSKCNLKVLGRGIVGLSMQLDLLKPPVSNISVNFNIKKKLSGYRPFLYNVTFDFCRYQKHKNSYPLFKIIHGTIMNSSNFDHNCPYNHSIIIDNYVVKDESFKLTPFPSGSYLYEIIIGAYNIWRAVLTVYFDVKLN